MAGFKLQAETVVKSASLELNAQQLYELAEALPHVREARDILMPRSTEAYEALEPVQDFLEAVASLVNQTGVIKPKRKIARKKKAASKEVPS